MKTLLDVLVFLRLVDAQDGRLSLTSIGLIIVLVRIALVQDPTLTDLGALFGVLAMYSYKKTIHNGRQTESEEIQATKKELTDAQFKAVASLHDRLVTVENRTRAPANTFSPVRR